MCYIVTGCPLPTPNTSVHSGTFRSTNSLLPITGIFIFKNNSFKNLFLSVFFFLFIKSVLFVLESCSSILSFPSIFYSMSMALSFCLGSGKPSILISKSYSRFIADITFILVSRTKFFSLWFLFFLFSIIFQLQYWILLSNAVRAVYLVLCCWFSVVTFYLNLTLHISSVASPPIYFYVLPNRGLPWMPGG